MALINFQKRFADDVEAGIKRQTIRAPRKRPIKVGEILYLYTGVRTKQAHKLKEVICKSVENITIWDYEILIGGVSLYSIDHLHNFAISDGFEDYHDMMKWFRKTHSLPFNGQLIKW